MLVPGYSMSGRLTRRQKTGQPFPVRANNSRDTARDVVSAPAKAELVTAVKSRCGSSWQPEPKQ